MSNVNLSVTVILSIMITGFVCGTFADSEPQDTTKLLFGKIFSTVPEKCIDETKLNLTSRNLFLPCYECFCQVGNFFFIKINHSHAEQINILNII